MIASALGRGAGWLEPEEVERLLRCYGLPVIESRTGRHARRGRPRGERARRRRWPSRRSRPASLHKSDVGAVEVDLSGPGQAQEAAERMADARARSGT